MPLAGQTGLLCVGERHPGSGGCGVKLHSLLRQIEGCVLVVLDHRHKRLQRHGMAVTRIKTQRPLDISWLHQHALP